MGVMGGAPVAAQRADQYHTKLTWSVWVAILVGASGGAMYGYDIGITGGVTSMYSWQVKFFPAVAAAAPVTTNYCKLDNQLLQLFTSSLYLAAMASALAAGSLSKRFGRKAVMMMGGFLFIIGTALQAAAENLPTLLVGRIMWGFGCGLSNQAAPLWLSEMSPYKWRGAVNMAFQMALTSAICLAGVVNYKAAAYAETSTAQGWRFSLGLGVLPAACLFLGGWFVPDSPASLVARGQLDTARAVLEKIRGEKDVDAEFEDLVFAATAAARVPNQWKAIIKPRYRPQLIVSIMIPFFQQWTGINALMFYAPQVFAAMGGEHSSTLLSTVIITAVNAGGTIVALILVDRVGRRWLLLESGFQMGITLIITGVVLGVEFGKNDGVLDPAASQGILTVMCLFIAGYAWSWGPMTYLVPTEIHTMETRSAGVSAAVFTNLIFTFVIGQSFLSMLCGMEYGVFLFFAVWCVCSIVFVYFLLPETNGVPMEDMEAKFRANRFWGPTMGPIPEPVMDTPGGSVSDIKVHLEVVAAQPL